MLGVATVALLETEYNSRPSARRVLLDMHALGTGGRGVGVGEDGEGFATELVTRFGERCTTHLLLLS